MDADLDTLATALYVKIDDLLKAAPEWAPARPAVGIAPKLSDAELNETFKGHREPACAHHPADRERDRGRSARRGWPAPSAGWAAPSNSSASTGSSTKPSPADRDPLHLAAVFDIDAKTAVRYANNARQLLTTGSET